MQEIFFAKSEVSYLYGRKPYVCEHLKDVAETAAEFASVLNLSEYAQLAGMFHDFGKYSLDFQNVLLRKREHVDHAVCGAVCLWQMVQDKAKARDRARTRCTAIQPIIEAVCGHHDGLRSYDSIRACLGEICRGGRDAQVYSGKTPALIGPEAYKQAFRNFHSDFPDYRLAIPGRLPEFSPVERMLYTRMLFSCLVDADYSVSAADEEPDYRAHTEHTEFCPSALLDTLYRHCASIKGGSTASGGVNSIRDALFQHCGGMGEQSPPGLFTLTAPTGTGKTLALLHFALRHCAAHDRERIILVLPYLTLADQSEDTYRHIFPPDTLLVDHSLSELSDEQREVSSRWTVPVIITTTVKFFESLFASRPTDCRKLHSIANSVILFDEAQSLPIDVTACTLRAIKALCEQWRCTVVFSTATQPEFSQILGNDWNPTEILPPEGILSPRTLYQSLRRVRVEWRQEEKTSSEDIAAEMTEHQSVCAIMNLRRHARKLYEELMNFGSSEEETFFLTTDLCPAHRRAVVKTIQNRLREGKPCRVVATQCIEAGVDLDFDLMYRALAPLEAVIQAAGRCNRNGKLSLGRVVVFVPDEDGRLFPDDWYENAANQVRRLSGEHEIDIDNPEHIREYYEALFSDAADRHNLTAAIEALDFPKTAEEYKLIQERGVQVLVPYPLKSKDGDTDLYAVLVGSARSGGVTRAWMKEAAPLTVTTFQKDIETYAEQLNYPSRRGIKPEASDYYILRPQFTKDDDCIYTAKTGLQFPDTASNDGSFCV